MGLNWEDPYKKQRQKTGGKPIWMYDEQRRRKQMAFTKSDQRKYRNLLLSVFFHILVILLSYRVFAYAAHEESTCWNHIISIVAGDCFTAGLRDDGCVVFVGDGDV